MELVTFTASDGVELQGWLQSPVNAKTQLAVDALLFLHGAAGNFYGSSLLRGLSPALLDAGVSVFAINTRGHDLATSLRTPRGGQRGGAAFEIVDDCRHDARGAVDALVARGLRRVALAGHSLGAIKSLYAQAFAPHDAVKFVLAVSPACLSFDLFSAGPRRDEFRDIVARAEALVAAGRPLELMDVTLPLPLLITAAGYLDKYGPSERYNLLKFAGRVPCPTLFTFGSQELTSGNAAFSGLDAAIRQLAASASSIDVEVVAGADHFYSGHTPRLAKTLLDWPQWQPSAVQ